MHLTLAIPHPHGRGCQRRFQPSAPHKDARRLQRLAIGPSRGQHGRVIATVKDFLRLMNQQSVFHEVLR
ncbi:hypothetical protein [Verrucomicrobium spinosum]|uniref:hypothetical protein n=1 Tax=Verrucomicrobium spinosum TaxID=2736 RepID=UPI0021097C8B|nr:hypothetical protein [Verrucomicrobium spinosum]